MSSATYGNPIRAPREELLKKSKTTGEVFREKVQSLRPGRDHLVDLAFSAAFVALALLGFRTGYFGWRWVLAGVIGLLLGLAIAHVVTTFRLPAVVTLAALAVVYFLLGGPLVIRTDLIIGVIPSLSTFADLGTTVVHGWKRLLTMLPPIDSVGSLLALPYLVGLVGAAVTYTVARRWPNPYAVLLAPLGLLALSIGLGTLEPASLLAQGAAFALLAIGWMVARAARFRAPLQNGAGKRTRLGIGEGLLVLAGLAGYFVGPHLPGATAEGRSVARSVVQPPFDIAQFPSPLAGYRKYTEPNNAKLYDKEILKVEGAPAGTPLRFATLDAYNTSVWGAANRAQTGTQDPGAAFQQVGSRVAPHGSGTPTTMKITVPEGGYSGVWLPTAGNVTGVAFSGGGAEALKERLWLNIDTNTALVPARLQAGDTYTMDTLLPPTPEQLPKAQMLGNGSLTEDVDLGFLDAKIDSWTRNLTDPWEQVRAVAGAMKNDGAYTDGGEQNPIERYYLPGHSQGRLLRFVGTTQLAGNDEQYAATLALVANRLGVPARVVMGALVPEGGSVKGQHVHAWVEVQTAAGEWTSILPQDFVPNRNQKPNQLQTKSQEQKVGALVPPPAGVNPPSVLQGPDQAQNATNLKKPPKKLLDPSLWPWWLRLLFFWVLLPILALALLYGAIVGLKAWRRNRHATRGPTTTRIAWAWDDLMGNARSYGHPLPKRATRLEQAQALQQALDSTPLAAAANAHVFGPGTPTDEDAAGFWRDTNEARKTLRANSDFWRRLRSDVDPRPLFAKGPVKPGPAESRLRIPALRRAAAS